MSRSRRRLRLAASAVAMTAAGLAVTAREAHAQTPAQAAFDSRMLADVNQDRAGAGLAPLRSNPALHQLAEGGPAPCGVGGRVDDMLARNYFSHDIPGCGTTVIPWLSWAGVRWVAAGENIGWEAGSTDPAAAADYLNQLYMNSPEHRANILNPAFTDVGLGGAQSGSGQTYQGQANVWISDQVFAAVPGVVLVSAPAPAPAPAAAPAPAPAAHAVRGHRAAAHRTVVRRHVAARRGGAVPTHRAPR